MKLLLLLSTLIFGISSAKAQCSVSINDSLYSSFDYVLNAANVTGTAPFQFTWTVTDGNGMPMNFTQNSAGDSITISAQTLQNSYGCVVYQLCMTDALACTTCTTPDTSALQIPFNCASAFISSIVGTNQVAITTVGNIPQFLIQQQFMQWNDGTGQSQGMPYMGPGTILTYTPGPQNPSDKFYLCVMTILTNGGCISCDSVPYTMTGLNDLDFKFEMNPNPANEYLSIQSDELIQSFAILNVMGTVVLLEENLQQQNSKIDVAELPNGIYFIRLKSINGIATKRIVIKH